jgi:hypothetical protein
MGGLGARGDTRSSNPAPRSALSYGVSFMASNHPFAAAAARRSSLAAIRQKARR